ncbi:MAG: hypothetical protein ABSG81_16960, partial [Acidimicrobiales bacterium]
MAVVVARDLGLELLDEEGALGAGPDERHVALEDVPQLRQLVETGDPQDPADAGDGVVARVPVHIRAGVDPHGTELEDLDDDAALAHALLAEVDGAGARELHGGGDDGVQRGHDQQRGGRHRGVEGALHGAGVAPQHRAAQAQQRVAPHVVDGAVAHRGGQLVEAGQDVDLDRGALARPEHVDHVGLARHAEGHHHPVDALLGQDHAQHAHAAEQRQRQAGRVHL